MTTTITTDAARNRMARVLEQCRHDNPAHADSLRLSRDGGSVLLVCGARAFVLYSTCPRGLVVNCRGEDDSYPTVDAGEAA